MLTRNKVFEHSLKIWSEKQKDPHLNSALTKEEFAALQCIVDDAATLIKRLYILPYLHRKKMLRPTKTYIFFIS